MADTDWTELNDGLGPGGTAETRFAVTYGLARPPSSVTNNFLAGFASTTTTDGAAGWFCNYAGFVPMPKGGSIRGALKRAVSDDVIGFAPLLFIGMQDVVGLSADDKAYILGLSDEDPHRIVLCKGKISDGVPASTATGDTVILRASADTFENDTWLHLRLDMTVNLTGDVLLDVKRNDVDTNKIGSAPVWAAVDGMAQFVDDALGANSGSLPFTDGRGGFAFWSNDLNRRGLIDQIEILKQV